MSDEGTRDLIDDLVADLSPVSRVPSLRAALLAVLGAWAASFLIGLAIERTGGGVADRMLAHWSVLVIAFGLGAAAVAGALTGLAASVPGREALQRRARRVALGGLGVAAITALLAAIAAGTPRILPIPSDGGCFGLGVGLALLPGGVLLALLSRGWVQRPRSAAAMALVGGFGLGAVTMQILCPVEGARHMLFGHVGIPVVMTGLLLLPLGLWLSRIAR